MTATSTGNHVAGRCLSADRAGVYSMSEGGGGGRVWKVVRESGVN
jgi:hypothetical protein